VHAPLECAPRSMGRVCGPDMTQMRRVRVPRLIARAMSRGGDTASDKAGGDTASDKAGGERERATRREGRESERQGGRGERASVRASA
jgi:hypothetical protein